MERLIWCKVSYFVAIAKTCITRMNHWRPPVESLRNAQNENLCNFAAADILQLLLALTIGGLSLENFRNMRPPYLRAKG